MLMPSVFNAHAYNIEISEWFMRQIREQIIVVAHRIDASVNDRGTLFNILFYGTEWLTTSITTYSF